MSDLKFQFHQGTNNFQTTEFEGMKRVVGQLLKPSKNLTVEHIVFAGETPSRYNGNRGVKNITVSGGGTDNASVYIKQKALIGFRSSFAEESDSNDNMLYIRDKDFFFLLDLLNKGDSWIRGELAKKIFITNTDGMITGISSHQVSYPMVHLANGNFLSIAPAILQDDMKDDIFYQSIVFKTVKGTFCYLTGHEFLTLSLHLRSYILNAYPTNLNLLTLAATGYLNRK